MSHTPVPPPEAGVGLGIGLCSVPYLQCVSGIFVHTLSPGSVAHLDGRLRYVPVPGPQQMGGIESGPAEAEGLLPSAWSSVQRHGDPWGWQQRNARRMRTCVTGPVPTERPCLREHQDETANVKESHLSSDLAYVG